MNSDNAMGILLMAGLGLAVWSFILMAIISSANETKRRDKIQLQNQKILALLAEKMGVDINKINEIYDQK